MRKGEVWWADLPSPIGKRPVLLLSRDDAYAVRTSVTVAPLTTTIRKIPVEIPLLPKEGVPKACVVNCDRLMTINKSLLLTRITNLSDAKLAAVDQAISFALDLPS